MINDPDFETVQDKMTLTINMNGGYTCSHSLMQAWTHSTKSLALVNM